MALSPKLTEDGKSIVIGESTENGRTWKGPVYVNDETGKEIVVDAPHLFDVAGRSREEAKTRREALEALNAKIAESGFEADKLVEVAAEVKDLRDKVSRKSGQPRDPTADEIEAVAAAKWGEEAAKLRSTAKKAMEDRELALKDAERSRALHRDARLEAEFTLALAAAKAAGLELRAGSVPDAKLAFKSEWEINDADGRPVTYSVDGEGRKNPRMGSDPQKLMTPAEWLAVKQREGREWWPEKADGKVTIPGAPVGFDPHKAKSGQLFDVAFQSPTN